MDILGAFEHSLGEYQNIQKSKHWKKYNARRHLYTLANLENFRNSQLCEGIEPVFSPELEHELCRQLILDVGEEYVRENLENKNVGNGQHYFVQDGLTVDGRQCYEIKWLYDLETKVFAGRDIRVVCEIGGGYGSFAQKIRSRFGCRFILIDLPEANVLSSYYLSEYFPEAKFLLANEIEGGMVTKKHVELNDFIIIPPWYALADDVAVDLFINTRSMMEMNATVVKKYFALIQNHVADGGFFFNLNRYEKLSVGYPIRLFEYPYDQKWTVVLSEPAWLQKGHHLLLTARSKSRGNIKEELGRIEKIGGKFISEPKNLARKLWKGIKNTLNKFRYQ